MSKTVYKNARILIDAESIIENGVIVVEHAQKDFDPPMNGETPVKIAPSVSDKIGFIGSAEAFEEKYGKDVSFNADDELVDVEGNTVMPGLVDTDARLDTLNPAADDHVDNIGIAYRTILSYRSAAEALNSGVTTVRAEGMPNNIDIALKNAVAKTLFFGPNVLATGPVYGVTAGKGHEKYGMIECSGTDAFRAQLRIHISRGLEGVTFQVTGDRLASLGGEYHKEMSLGELSAMTKHAKGAEKPVAANASGKASIKACIEAGVDCIQQGYRIGEEELKEMAEKGIAYIPCLVSTLGTEIEEEHKAVAAAAIKAGVNVVVGTEILPSQPIDGTTAIIKEMELLAEAGMTPLQAIAAATSQAAKVCRAKAGILKEGGKADFIVVAGKPDEDIHAMRTILSVIKDGRRAFNQIGGAKERMFHINGPGYEVAGGTTFDWTEGTVQGVKEPESYNERWNLIKEI